MKSLNVRLKLIILSPALIPAMEETRRQSLRQTHRAARTAAAAAASVEPLLSVSLPGETGPLAAVTAASRQK